MCAFLAIEKLQKKIMFYSPDINMSTKTKDPEIEKDLDEVEAAAEEEEEEEEEYVVEKILDVRVKGGKKEFYLKWKGYPE